MKSIHYISPIFEKIENVMPVPPMNELVPGFQDIAIIRKKEQEISLDTFNERFLVLLFYPADFTEMSASEILAFSDRASDFEKINTVVVAVSPDSYHSHLAWINTPRSNHGLENLEIPLLSDKSFTMCKDYGVLNEETGVPYRALFIIDSSHKLRQITMNDLPVSRSVNEIIRLIQAIQFSDEVGDVCPVNWKPGDKAMKPNTAGKLEYFQSTTKK